MLKLVIDNVKIYLGHREYLPNFLLELLPPYILPPYIFLAPIFGSIYLGFGT